MYVRVSRSILAFLKKWRVNARVIVPYFSSRQVADNTRPNKHFIVRLGKCREVQKYSAVTYWSFGCSYLGCTYYFHSNCESFDRNSIMYQFLGDTRNKTSTLLYFQLCRIRWIKIFFKFLQSFLYFDNRYLCECFQFDRLNSYVISFVKFPRMKWRNV